MHPSPNLRPFPRVTLEIIQFSKRMSISVLICCLLLMQPKYHDAAAKSLQLCPTLCDLIDGSPPGSPVPGILQARTLEWVAISFSNA